MKRFILITICLMLGIWLSGCAYTTITKPDGTTIRHYSLLVNTKSIAITIAHENLEMILGSQVVDLKALQSALDAYMGKIK